LSKALSFSCSAAVSTDSSCSSFATCRVIVSAMTRLPAAVGAISLPRRSHGFLVYDDGEPRELHSKAGFVA
jgi:hypothetical protein